VAAAVLCAAGCYSPVPLSALGFQCSLSSACDATTTCRHGTCQLPYPNAANTGVPAGVQLSAVDAGTLQIASSIAKLDVNGCVEVTASGVAIRQSRITCGNFCAITVDPGVTGTVVQDVELVSTGSGGTTGVCGDHFTVQRANIHAFRSAADLGDEVTIEGSFIHDLAAATGVAALRNGAGCSNVVLQSNWVSGVSSQAPAILMTSAGGPINNLSIQWNYLDGAGWILQIEDDPGYSPVTQVTVTGNAFGPDATWGPIALVGFAADGGGNYDDVTGQPISLQ
jgi:hypothetical protein